MPPLPEDLFESALSPASAPIARASAVFRFFAFTSSPHDCKKLGNSDLRVKASPLFPSPVKAKKNSISFTRKTHWINELRVKVRVKAGITNSLSARCAGACPFARTEVRMRKQRVSWSVKARASFQKKADRKKRKEGTFRKKVHKFSFDFSPFSKTETFFSQSLR